MPTLDLTEEQIIALVDQLTDEQKRHLLQRLQQPAAPQSSPVFGIAKGAIVYMAPDFDAPLDDFKEYME